MQVLRQTLNIKDNLLHVVLPSNFEADTVEVIILPIKEPNKLNELKNSERFYGAISRKTAEKLYQHLIL
jgi:hypothetical protein